MAIVVNRKQRLRTLEKDIRKLADNIHKNALEVARDLLEIKEEHLWKEVGYTSFEKYVRENSEKLCGRSPTWSLGLVGVGEVDRKLKSTPIDWSTLQASHYNELVRLAPTERTADNKGNAKNFRKLKVETLTTVLNAAKLIAAPDPPSVRDVRKAVDARLGIKRAKKKEEDDDDGIDLAEYIRQRTGTIQGMIANLAAVPADGWKLLEDTHPLLAEEMAAVCDELAGLLRS